MPGLEAALSRFQAAHTQVLGVSVDSVYSHANWAKSLGGVSFPLLSDFQPRGAVADSFGAFLAGAGITDRATVLIDSDGIVQHASSVTPAGSRDIDELVKLCEQHNDRSDCTTLPFADAAAISSGTTLFVKSDCGPSHAAALTVANLHLDNLVAIRNVTDDAGARSDFEAVSEKQQAPCLLMKGELLFESADISKRLASLVSDL